MPETPFPEPSRRHGLARRIKGVTGRLRGASGLSAESPPAHATAFTRTLWTALNAPPHPRSAGSTVFGANRPNAKWRWVRTLRQNGYTAEGRPADPRELALVHGAIVAALQSRRGSGSQRVIANNRVHGRLARVEPTQPTERGGCGWTRLCVDAETERHGDAHLDVALVPLSEHPDEHARDVAALLPEGLPPQVSAALAAGQRPVQGLHLLGDGRVAVDELRDYRVDVFDGVRHPMTGSLLVSSGRIVRAEIWLTRRKNTVASLVDFFGDLLEN